MGLPGCASEGASREYFNPLKHSITSHVLLKQAQGLKPFIEWLKPFPLALFVKLDTRIIPVFSYFTILLALLLIEILSFSFGTSLPSGKIFMLWDLLYHFSFTFLPQCIYNIHNFNFYNSIFCLILTFIVFQLVLAVGRIVRCPQDPPAMISYHRCSMNVSKTNEYDGVLLLKLYYFIWQTHFLDIISWFWINQKGDYSSWTRHYKVNP